MKTQRLVSPFLLSVSAAMLLAFVLDACGDESAKSGDDNAGGDGDANGDGDGADDDDDDGDDDDGDDDDDDEGDDDDDDDDDEGDDDDDDDDDDDVDPQANGSPCASDDECESGFCTPTPVGDSVCSECATAQDCVDAGTGINCALVQGGPGYYECSSGELGESCESDDSCADALYCAELIEGTGFSACSECADDSHCTDEELCVVNTPDDPDGIRYKECAALGTLPNGEVCELDGNGDAACIGWCVEIAGVGIGVCGDCRPDESDCPDGETCEPPSFIPPMTLEGSACVDGDDTGDDDDDTGTSG